MRARARSIATLTAACLAVLGSGIAPNQANAAPAEDLIFSVYIEGSGNNKALEVYNPTEAAVNLSGYHIDVYNNGSPTAHGNSTTLPDQVLAAGEYFVIYNPAADPSLASIGDWSSAVTYFNGDDALVLRKGATVLDSIGQVGIDPGTRWASDGVATVNATLTKSGCEADADPGDPYPPSALFSATGIDDLTTLGTLTCDQPAEPDPELTPIGAVQGSGDISPLAGTTVTIEGVITGSFQGSGQFGGFYLQDAGDQDAATSDGIFVYAPTASTYQAGTTLRVTGRVAEYYGQTQVTAETIDPDVAAMAMPATTQVSLPHTDWERYESMMLGFPQSLAIAEYYNFGRYGEIVYATDRQWTPTGVVDPGATAVAYAAENLAHRITVDDGRSTQNPTPARHPNGAEFTTQNYFRGGDLVTNLTGVLSYGHGQYKLQPTQPADYARANPRPAPPNIDADLTVASFNVLNYFTTLTSESASARGADTAEEFTRQQIKIVEAITALDADVVGLIEIENNGTAVANLVTALNSAAGTTSYAAVTTGVLGTDAIVQALIYQPEAVEPVGDWAALDFADGRNRPALAQTFRHLDSGELVTVSINHLKSKGSNCDDTSDPDTGDGQGNCNQTRLAAANALAAWLDGDPTGQGAERRLVLGDLNSYDQEDPIAALAAAGYTDLLAQSMGEYTYSYVFDGQLGYLDHALANPAALADVVGAAVWHINADEVNLFDYDMSFKAPAEDELWQANPYRSSDHDPVIVGLDLTGDEPGPEPASASPPAATPSQAMTPPASPTATSVGIGLPATGAPSQRQTR
ncbi:MAG: ExeM/NucH family extracellular endonuclease [Arachnia sp.]